MNPSSIDLDRANPPILVGGRYVCAEHRIETCPPCSAAEARRAALVAARDRIAADRARVRAWAGAARADVGGLGGLPRAEFARADNADWCSRTNLMVVSGIRETGLCAPILISAPARDGKTTGLDCVFKEIGRAVFDAAAEGPIEVPPALLYATGYELGEAVKLRHYGQEPHGLIVKASRVAVLVLDEVHSLHTPLADLFALLDRRARSGLPTLTLTGMRLDEFGAWVGAAALTRVFKGPVIDAYKSASAKVRAVR